MAKKRYVLAVSGGIDSVVLLDMATKWLDAELVVAHFDHGMRDNSIDDAEFAMELAKKYRLPFEMQRAQLGAGASEQAARRARYAFLQRIAKKYDGQIVTAHHKDDVLETIIINFLRGTGWRGLSSLRSGEIFRPLLEMDKQKIIAYAKNNDLAWREDPTNTNEAYLRNYVRHAIMPQFSEAHRDTLFALYKDQCGLFDAILDENEKIVSLYHDKVGYRRHLFIMVEPKVARELLHFVLHSQTGHSATRPQLDRAVHAIKTFRPRTYYDVGDSVKLRFSRTHMIVEAPRN